MSTNTVHIFCEYCGEEITPTAGLQAPYICSHCSLKEEEDSVEEFIPLPEDEEEESFVGRDVKTLTGYQLRKAMEEVDEDRKMHCRRLRGLTWSQEDEEIMKNMDDWAQKVFDELRSR